MPQKTPREQIVGEFWSVEAARRARGAGEPLIDWTMSPTVQRMINRRVSGSEDVDWLEWLRRSFYPMGMGPVLSIGCGAGGLERDMLLREMCVSVVGVDIAQGALDAAREASGDLEISYEMVDIENDPLPPGPFDAVFAVATIHHISRLAHLAEKLYSVLKSQGYLFILEYVGPSRFQWTEDQLRLVGDIYSMLPWSHRMHFQAGGTVAYPDRTPPCSMIRSDPSEAVRSSEIEGVLGRYFELQGEKALGGTLLNPLLGGVLESFDEESEFDGGFIRRVGLLEEELIEAGVLPSDFKAIIYRKVDDPAPAEGYSQTDDARARLISSQERRIAGLHQRFLDLDERCELLRSEISRTDEAAGEEGARVELQVQQNARLKRGAVFALARLAKGRGPAGECTKSECPEGEPVSGSRCAPAVFGTGDQMASPLARAARRYVTAVDRGTATLWLFWILEMLGARPERMLGLGLEPWQEGMLRDLGPLDTKLSGGEEWDLVFLGAGASGEVVKESLRSMREGASLVALDEELEIETDELTPWDSLSVPAGCIGEAAEVMRRVPEGREEEARALAGLIVYVGSVRAGLGLIPAEERIRVYRKGPPASGIPGTAGGFDIAEVQEAEIDRLHRGVQHRSDVAAALESALAGSQARLEAARAQSRRLSAERDILQRGGWLVYWRLLRLRLSHGVSPGGEGVPVENGGIETDKQRLLK